ncbi:COG3650 family protein [Azotobacter armeniacus]
MRLVRTLLYCLLPLLTGCQLFAGENRAPKVEQVRLQGELSVRDGDLLLRPCDEQRRFVLVDAGDLGLAEEVRGLQGGGSDPLFADLRGILGASDKPAVDGRFELNRLYRLELGGRGCQDPDFRRVILRATGNEPFWSVSVGTRGLLLQRPDQPPLALPYLEERLPGGALNLTSEADGRSLQLWVAPQRCVDSMSGAVHHLSAELRLHGEVQRGCAYFGGGRED